MAKNFADCIRNSTKENKGPLSKEDADQLIARYAFHVRQLQATGKPNPLAGARDAVAAELKAVAAQKRADVVDAIRVRNELAAYAQTYTKPNTNKPDIFGAFMNVLSNIGFGAGRVGLEGLALAKFNLGMGQMKDAFSEFYRSRITGGRFNKPLGKDIAMEMHGQDSGSAEAKGLAKIFADGIEYYRTEWNRVSGRTITPLKNWMPQYHDPRAVLDGGGEKGFNKWRDYIKPKLDLDRMVDPVSGGKLTPDRLDEVLRGAWENITTGGWTNREPKATPFGIGKLANQRQEHRFLHFKRAEDWLAYDRNYGRGGDPVEALLHHFRGMSEDIAAMEVLGRNPAATVEWMVQTVEHEAAKHVTGKPSLYDPGITAKRTQDKMGSDGWRLRGVYNLVTQADAPVSKRTAMIAGDVRNFITAAQLGGTVVLATIQDPWLDRQARLLSGIPVAAGIPQILKVFGTGQRDVAVRAALGFDDFFHGTAHEARFVGALGGHGWSRWLADRTMNLSGLEPLTQRRKHQFGLDFAGMVADHTKHSWDELANANAPFRRTMEDYGLGEKDWNKLKTATAWQPHPDSAGLMRPIDVAQVDERLAERYLGMILGQTERAVPTKATRSSAAVVSAFKRGTVAGELAQSVLQYKGFTLSFMLAQWQAVQMVAAGPSGKLGGAAYAGSTLLGLTLAGAAAMQLNSIRAGKDVQHQDLAFWLQAIQYGGGLGIFGDFMLADVNRFGHTPVEAAMGPTFGAAVDVGKMALQFGKGVRGQKTQLGRNLVNDLGRYTPVVASLWYTRAAYRRMVIDQLMHLADPDSASHFRAQETSLYRESGQRFWWRPGEKLPSRPPAISETGSHVR